MSKYWSNGVATLHQADARAMPLPDASVHCVVTSPPYWGLRDYGLESGIGLEPTLGEWVANVVAVMREVRRVLRDDGTCWLNLGDAYSANRGYQVTDNKHVGVGNTMGMTAESSGLAPKNLMGQPWRVAFALQDDGWILRSAIVWHKPNPMPESVTDRPTNAYEQVFLLAKQGRYFYDAEAMREAQSEGTHERFGEGKAPRVSGKKQGGSSRHNPSWEMSTPDMILPNGRNARNVWSIPTQGRPDAHFATFPDELPRRCILAGTSERGVCADCGAPWVRQTSKAFIQGTNKKPTESYHTEHADKQNRGTNFNKDGLTGGGAHNEITTLGWQPTCGCNAATVPATVLDPFAGSGTTLAVAQALGRHSVGLDLNAEYLEIAAKRIGQVSLPMMLA